MAKNRTLQVQASTISVIVQNEIDYINLTDMTTSFREGSGLIGKWMTNKNTLEYLSVWERINNPTFNYPEFGVIEKEAGTNRFVMSVGQWIDITKAIEMLVKAGRYGGTFAHKDIVALFGMTAKDWRDQHPDKQGNVRDHATLEQLVVLSNLESINALLIQQGLSQSERLIQLNQVAITQMKSLLQSKAIKKLK